MSLIVFYKTEFLCLWFHYLIYFLVCYFLYIFLFLEHSTNSIIDDYKNFSCIQASFLQTTYIYVYYTQSAQISHKQDERNIYVIMKTMCPPGYYHNGFVATHA